MPVRIGFRCKSTGLESANFQSVYFGDITLLAMAQLIETITSGSIVADTVTPQNTLDAFNALSDAQMHQYLNSYFTNPSYVRGLTINAKSLKSNGAALGSDSATITEVTSYDNQWQDLLFANTEFGYGYVIIRGSNGLTGYLPGEYIYSGIFLHNAGYGFDQIKALTGAAGIFSGSANSNLSTSAQADTTNFNAWSITTKHVIDGWEKIGNNTNGNRFRLIPSSGNTISAATIKTLNYIAMVFTHITNTIAIRFFNNETDTTQCGFQIDKNGSYWRLSSPTLGWFDTVTFNGSGGVPEVLWTQTVMLELIITDTYVKVRWNGDDTKTYNLTKTSTPLIRATFDTQIGSSTRRTMDTNHSSSIVATFGALLLFTYHPGTTSNTTPDSLISAKITAFLKKVARK